ncbi:MAG TPA: SAM-dependent methyltransferase, partial [Actinomycetota bacterium]|nr:SAM-dependent methyltransferase [Actinomycetota bacterium]
LATAVDTIVILMANGSLPGIVAELISGGRSPSTPAAIVENGTLDDQRVTTCALEDLPAQRKGTPSLVVIGAAVGARSEIAWFSEIAATASSG